MFACEHALAWAAVSSSSACTNACVATASRSARNISCDRASTRRSYRLGLSPTVHLSLHCDVDGRATGVLSFMAQLGESSAAPPLEGRVRVSAGLVARDLCHLAIRISERSSPLYDL